MENQNAPKLGQSILDPKVDMVKKFKGTSMKEIVIPAVIIVVVVLLGIGTGWFMAGRAKGVSSEAAPGVAVTSKEAGITDEKAFPDTVQGTLETGGMNGEGTHHLVQEGGDPSRYVYLTSTVINLDAFVGKKVQIWGQTIAGKKAGWLMDVGKIKITE